MLAVVVGCRNLEAKGQDTAGLEGVDQRVNVPASRGVAGIEPALVIGARLFRALLEIDWNRLPSGFQLLEFRAVYRLHRGISFHDADAGSRPAKGEIRIEALPGHGVVTGAARVIQSQNDLRH